MKTVESSKAVVMSELANTSQEDIAEEEIIEVPQEENIPEDVRENREQFYSGSDDIAMKERLGDSQYLNFKLHLM